MPDYRRKKPAKSLPPGTTRTISGPTKPTYTASPAAVLSADDLLNDIKKVSDVQYSRAKMIVYGPQGSGKTRFAATSPNPIVMQFSEEGEKSLGGSDVEFQDLYSKGVVHPQVVCELIDRYAEKGYESLVIDEMPRLRRNYLALILKKEHQEDVPNTLSWGTASRDQWGKVAEFMTETIDYAIKHFPGHVIFTSQETTFQNEDEDKDNGLEPYVASDIGGPHKYLHRVCDYELRAFYYMDFGDPETGTEDTLQYALRCTPSPPYRAKFRVGINKTPPVLINDPTWDKFLDYADLASPSSAQDSKTLKRRKPVQ